MYYFKVGMVTLITIVVWSTIVVAGALIGWWRQPLAPTDDAQAFIRSAIKMIDQGNRGHRSAQASRKLAENESLALS